MPGDYHDWPPGFLHWQLVGGDSRSREEFVGGLYTGT